MELKEIARELQGKAANAALRMPISWVNLLAGAPITVDGRTLDTRTQWFLQLLARSGQQPLHRLGVQQARSEFDMFQAARRRSARSSTAPSPARPAGCACASTVRRARWRGCCRPSSTSTAAAG
jgi:hypothetical protein